MLHIFDVFWELTAIASPGGVRARFLIFDDGNSLFLHYWLSTRPLVTCRFLKETFFEVFACELTVLCITQ